MSKIRKHGTGATKGWRDQLIAYAAVLLPFALVLGIARLVL